MAVIPGEDTENTGCAGDKLYFSKVRFLFTREHTDSVNKHLVEWKDSLRVAYVIRS